MDKQTANPWTWQESLGFWQAVLVEAPQQTPYAAGQGSTDADGHLVHEGDMAGQVALTMATVEITVTACR